MRAKVQVVRDRARSYTRTYRGRGPTLAQALRNGVRPFDTVSRWGGEELAVLSLSATDVQQCEA